MTWGTDGDSPIPGDVDGDSKTDFVVFRPTTGTWFFNKSGGGTAFSPSTGTWYVKKSTGGTIVVTWGTSGDIPV
jgi:hypothetical protein